MILMIFFVCRIMFHPNRIQNEPNTRRTLRGNYRNGSNVYSVAISFSNLRKATIISFPFSPRPLCKCQQLSVLSKLSYFPLVLEDLINIGKQFAPEVTLMSTTRSNALMPPDDERILVMPSMQVSVREEKIKICQ